MGIFKCKNAEVHMEQGPSWENFTDVCSADSVIPDSSTDVQHCRLYDSRTF